MMKQQEMEAQKQEILDDLFSEFPVSSNVNIQAELLSEVETGHTVFFKKLKEENPFRTHQRFLKFAEKELKNNIVSVEALKQDFQDLKSLAQQTKTKIDLKKYWLSKFKAFRKTLKELSAQKDDPDAKVLFQQESEKLHEEQIICRTLLLQQWRKLLDEQYAQWEIEQIQEFRRKLLSRLGEWLGNLQLLADALHDLLMEPGLLFDLSKHNLSLSNIEELRRWAEYISQDEGIKALCDLLGRLRQVEKTKRQERIKHSVTVTEYVPDINSKEEIIGIRLGNDLEHVLPQEMALLSDEATEILFDMKFLEKRLMCFEMQGMQASLKEIEEEKIIEIEEEEKLGPMIVCVDTSSSMAGTPETIAKAITLFIATRALSQKRNCLLINFSTGIETLDLSGQIGLAKVIEFLQRSFHGGTDVAPAMIHALKRMNDEDYKRSDLLIISDFMMADLSADLHTQIEMAKANKNQFYSLSIGDMFLSQPLKKLFDHEWVYNPHTSRVHFLYDMMETLSKGQRS